MPSPKEPFGINLLKMAEGSSQHLRFGDAVSEARRCCLNVVIAGSLRCGLCLGHEDPSSPSAQLNASAQLLLFKTLSCAWWPVPATRSILDTQGSKAGAR